MAGTALEGSSLRVYFYNRLSKGIITDHLLRGTSSWEFAETMKKHAPAGSTDETVRTWSVDMFSPVPPPLDTNVLHFWLLSIWQESVAAVLALANYEVFVSQGRDRRDAELPIGREANALVWSPESPDQLATSAADNLIRCTAVSFLPMRASSMKCVFPTWRPAEDVKGRSLRS